MQFVNLEIYRLKRRNIYTAVIDHNVEINALAGQLFFRSLIVPKWLGKITKRESVHTFTT